MQAPATPTHLEKLKLIFKIKTNMTGGVSEISGQFPSSGSDLLPLTKPKNELQKPGLVLARTTRTFHRIALFLST
jgi:hypothetical protein